MYRFQVSAHTQIGDCIGLVGSAPELGLWDIARCMHLRTSTELYPLWRTDTGIDLRTSLNAASNQRVEYKYVRLGPNGGTQWEAAGPNRWVPTDSGCQTRTVLVDDGTFGCLQPQPFGYAESPIAGAARTENSEGLKIVITGSSVALGHKAWLLQGWAWLLGQTLQQRYGHRVVNVSETGANVSTTIDRFASLVAPQRPDIVVVALSLGNEGFASCPPHERRAVQRRFENGLRRFEEMVRALGARLILGGVYPNGNYSPEHHRLLWETHLRMINWGVPVLDWLAAVDDGRGRWKPGTFFDLAHPNSVGHRLMYEAIDLRLFQIGREDLEKEKRGLQRRSEIPLYRDSAGFSVSRPPGQMSLRIANLSRYSYTIAPGWLQLQTALRCQAGLAPGVYIAREERGLPSFFAIREDGTMETTLNLPPGTDLEYSNALDRFLLHTPGLLFHEGHLGLFKDDDDCFRVINESEHEYNIHPMWQAVGNALKAMPPGVYEDPRDPDRPFRTAMIGNHGLESRVRVPPRSAVSFRYKCALSALSRVAIVPLGDRCAVRMMLYKMGYDGPAFPFDLARTVAIADVADMIESHFQDLWNPAFLWYSPEEDRIYHTKWTGLSFAHEIEATDDPLNDIFSVYERMGVRYLARSERFWHTIRSCDEALFVRTGVTDRGGVTDLVDKLEAQCQGKPFRLLLLSPQSSDEFSGLPRVVHYDQEFNPDRMNEDLEHWMHCTQVMGGILEALGISSKNLFWCPPNPRQADPAE